MKEKIIIKYVLNPYIFNIVFIISGAPFVTRAWSWNTDRIQNSLRQFESG
jgi:hypothetical protein